MKRKNLADIIVMTMFGAIMYITKYIMEAFPNIHLLGMLIMVCTVVYRKKALIAVYIFVFLNGLLEGFTLWWVPYLYIWTVLWGITMLLPKKMKPKAAVPVYSAVCGLHGLLFGTLYAPWQALVFGLNLKGTVAWIIAGLPFDLIHCISNVITGLFVLPLVSSLRRFNKINPDT